MQEAVRDPVLQDGARTEQRTGQGPSPGRGASSGDWVIGGQESWAWEVKGMTIRPGWDLDDFWSFPGAS